MNTTQLDALAARITAYRSWAELLDATANGYAPTLRGRRGDHRDLARALQGAGRKVFFR